MCKSGLREIPKLKMIVVGTSENDKWNRKLVKFQIQDWGALTKMICKHFFQTCHDYFGWRPICFKWCQPTDRRISRCSNHYALLALLVKLKCAAEWHMTTSESKKNFSLVNLLLTLGICMHKENHLPIFSAQIFCASCVVILSQQGKSTCQTKGSPNFCSDHDAQNKCFKKGANSTFVTKPQEWDCSWNGPLFCQLHDVFIILFQWRIHI